jgi:hypothetical protein
VTIGLDGSSGSISLDKYGFAGQHAEVNQCIGAITIEAKGGYGTYPPIIGGSIFSGLAMGISDSVTADGATWTIPLIGLEKKMDDIALLNVPFFDGENLSTVTDFLCRYAGLVDDMSNADPSVQLGMSEDISVVRFDWKAGTTVRSALDDTMDDIQHGYVVRDGKVFFYQLDEITGLPVNLDSFTDWLPSYPDVIVVAYDKTPDFEDLRNEIAVIGLEQVRDGTGSEITGMPTYPRIEIRTITTVPDVPWAKVLSYPLPGYLDVSLIGQTADRLSAKLSKYELIGRTTIAGNASIKPYDRWGEYVIFGVTHNMDFRAKTWTTDLEFMRKTRTF